MEISRARIAAEEENLRIDEEQSIVSSKNSEFRRSIYVKNFAKPPTCANSRNVSFPLEATSIDPPLGVALATERWVRDLETTAPPLIESVGLEALKDHRIIWPLVSQLPTSNLSQWGRKLRLVLVFISLRTRI